MTLTRQYHGVWGLDCNSCSEYEETDADDFDDAVEQMKEIGWRYMGNSEHKCPSCIEKDEEEDERLLGTSM